MDEAAPSRDRAAAARAGSRIAMALALAGCAAALVLLGVRMSNVISFAEPLHLFTSGAEHESLYGIWRRVHGLTVYNDPSRIPYASSEYYNWLYFEFYGWVVRAVLGLFALDEAWLPTITRLTSFVVCIIGAALLYRTLAGMAPARSAYLRILALSLAVLLFFGPLAGFWTIATNVDFYALVLLIASLDVFCRLYGTHPVRALLLFCLLAYLSWSMKQIYVFGAGAVGLYLLIRRDWRGLAILVTVLPAAWAVTFLIGTETYARMIFLSGTELAFSLGRMARNLANTGVKTLPVFLGLAAAAWCLTRTPGAWARLRANPGFAIHALGAAVTLAFIVPASAQVGAAENYYFPAIYFLSALLYLAVAELAGAGDPPVAVSHALSVGWAATTLAVALVLAGLVGVLSTREWHERHLAIKACMDPLPKPVFTLSAYNMLPWMNPADQHFVLTYYYFRDRRAGREFERRGIGGLIEEGYFAALLLAPSVEGEFDGGSLARYRRLPETCANSAVWLRR